MKHLLTCAVCVLYFCTPSSSIQFDYYWRDFVEEIPKDAVPGGTDNDNKTTYIAQVYIPTQGILPTRLYEGKKTVTASRYGIHKSDLFIKVLSTAALNKLSWVPTTAVKLHTDSIGKYLVIGGVENGKILNIGRVSYQGEVIVGKVCGYNIGNALLYFPYGEEEISTAAYEVLVYNTNTINFDLRNNFVEEE